MTDGLAIDNTVLLPFFCCAPLPPLLTQLRHSFPLYSAAKQERMLRADTRPSSVLAPQTRELLVLMTDPIASVAHLDARARELAASIPVRKYIALAKDYHDEPTDSNHPTVHHKILLLSNTAASEVRLEEDANILPWSDCHLEPEPVDVRVRVAERDYSCARSVSPQELARVNKACLEHARTKYEAGRHRQVESNGSSSDSESYYSLDSEGRPDSVSTLPTSRGAVENGSLLDDRYCNTAEAKEAGPSQPHPRTSFLHMTDGEESEWEYMYEPSLIGSHASASSSSSPSSSARCDLYGAHIDPTLRPFCTLEYEAHLRRTRAPVVNVWYDLTMVDTPEDPRGFHDECAALASIMQDAERRLGRTASFSFSSASSRETLDEQTRAMLHPENAEWEGWPLLPNDTDSVMHSELSDPGLRDRQESFLIMTNNEKESKKTYRRRRLVMKLQRLHTELSWRCESALRLVWEGPSRREMRVLQDQLCGPFD
ncbi:hypothetical protein PENSPDRAFT_442394 [Peniophora sp. CONT]|nr:hypothetical protein PENSPDRAFT_442394 [Peniophora sp. CONT]